MRGLAVLAAMALTAAACGDTAADDEAQDDDAGAPEQVDDASDAADSEGEGSGEPASSSGEPITLLLPAGVVADTVQPAIDDFIEQTGQAVDTIILPVNDLRARQVLTLNNQAPELDVIMIEDSWVAEVVNHLDPLDERVEESDTAGYIDSVVEAFVMNDQQYALPFYMGVRSLIYREDLVQAAGLSGAPRTHDELREYAEALTTDEVYGFVGPYGNSETYVNQWLNLAHSSGLEGVLDANMERAVFADEAGEAATSLMGDMYLDGHMPPDSLELHLQHVNQAMLDGRAAMTILPLLFYESLSDPENSEHAGSFKIGPLPTANADAEPAYITTGWGLALSRYSEQPDAAWDLLRHVNQAFLHPADDAPRAILNSPASESAFNHPVTAEVYDDQHELVREMLTQATTRPKHPSWGNISTAIGDALQSVFLGDAEPADAIQQAQDRVNGMLGAS